MHPDFYLTPDEESLVENASWLLTKHRIIGKVYGVFGALSEVYSGILEEYAQYIPQEITTVSPKIYRGEHYRQLPYVMLDQPRYFKGNDTFAIRTFFWWGNNFSIHMLLAGKYKNMFEEKIISHLKEKSLDNWYFGISSEPWEHHFEKENYIPVPELNKSKAAIHNSKYLKLGRHHPIAEWKGAYPFFTQSYNQLLESLI